MKKNVLVASLVVGLCSGAAMAQGLTISPPGQLRMDSGTTGGQSARDYAPGQMKGSGASAKSYAPGQLKGSGESAKSYAPGQKTKSNSFGSMSTGPGQSTTTFDPGQSKGRGQGGHSNKGGGRGKGKH